MDNNSNNTEWTKEQIKKGLEVQALNITFIKKDGTERTMLCTRDFKTINENAEDFEFQAPKGKGCELPENLIRVWSIGDTGWRIVNLDTVQKVELDA